MTDHPVWREFREVAITPEVLLHIRQALFMALAIQELEDHANATGGNRD